jgi:Na+-driven multidrug efflux pump
MRGRASRDISPASKNRYHYLPKSPRKKTGAMPRRKLLYSVSIILKSMCKTFIQIFVPIMFTSLIQMTDRLSDQRLLAKLVPTFADRGV